MTINVQILPCTDRPGRDLDITDSVELFILACLQESVIYFHLSRMLARVSQLFIISMTQKTNIAKENKMDLKSSDSVGSTLGRAIVKLYEIQSDPEYMKMMQEERARVLEYKRKNYDQKLAYWNRKSGYVVHETDSGFRAYEVGSPEGKKLVAERNASKRENERLEFTSESPLDAAFDDICCGENPTTKIQIRQALSTYTGFTPEKFNTLIGMVEEEGIEVV